MGIHSIIEPAGTLLTGWELVPARDVTEPGSPTPADQRNHDRGSAPDPRAGDRTPTIVRAPQLTTSKWELREIG